MGISDAQKTDLMSDFLASLHGNKKTVPPVSKDRGRADNEAAALEASQGKIKVQRTIQTGNVSGSEAYRSNPEDIVVGENRPKEKRRDFEIVDRREQSAPSED